MEPELLTRNYQPPPSLKERLTDYFKNLAKRNKDVAAKIKNPKILTIIVLVLIFLVVLLAIAAITSNRRNTPTVTQSNTPPIVQTTTPTPSPKLSEVGIAVQEFNRHLDDNLPYYLKLKQPIVDLDLSFDK